MATASHLPFNRNGLKFFTKHGGMSCCGWDLITAAASVHWVHTSASCMLGEPACPSAGLDKMDIRWILEEAACDCNRMDVEPGNPAFDPAFVVNEARKVPPTSVVTSNFMDAYCASLRTEIINGVEVRC